MYILQNDSTENQDIACTNEITELDSKRQIAPKQAT